MGRRKSGKRSKTDGKVFLYDDHKLVTRRDFLAAGVIPFSAMVFPSLFLTKVARAACAAGAAPAGETMPAFVQLNLAGGAMLAANFVPRDAGGQLIPNMDLMGLGTSAGTVASQLSADFGGPTPHFFSPTDTASGLIRGIQSIVTSQTVANTTAIGVVVQNRDDSSLNPLDITGLVAASGLKGSMLPGLAQGGAYGHLPTLLTPPPPLIINSYQDILSAVGVAGPLGPTGLGAASPSGRGRDGIAAVFNLIDRLSESQASRFVAEGYRDTEQLQELLGCATESNLSLSSSDPPASDPRESTIAGTWGIAANTGAGTESVVFASALYSALLGYSGPVRLQRGGFDYHDGTRTSGDTRDFQAGQLVGRMLESARIMGKPLFLFLTTDGATRSEQSSSLTAPWVSDRGQMGMQLVFVFDPNGRPSTHLLSGTGQNAALVNQIGVVGNGQAASNSFTGDWNAERAGAAVFANYLAWAYRGSQNDWRATFNNMLAGRSIPNPFTAAELNRVMRLATS